MRRKRILILEPYYGGSHKQFLLGLQDNIDADFVFLTLPARKWKMRMQLAAPWFVEQLFGMKNVYFDTVLCSTFVDVAVFKALVTDLPSWNRKCTICTYYHENQFAYPNQIADSSIHQFTSINFTTALVSDKIAFNSKYNFETFISHCQKYLKKSADMKFQDTIECIENKTSIIYPGIDYSGFSCKRKQQGIPTICWNHRWEHDKGPDNFFETLYELRGKKNFNLIVLGKSFKHIPHIFFEAEKRLRDRIQFFGYAENKNQYIEFLYQSDIIVSTALHEFFGIAILEGVKAGCHPIVPDRLSYRELYPERFRYKEDQLFTKLMEAIDLYERGELERPVKIADKFAWERVNEQFEKWLK